MRVEVQYKWRTLWCGKMSTTRHWASEETIRAQHPEAVCLPHTRRELLIPETPEEREAQYRATDTSWAGRNIPGAPGG